MNYLGRDIQPGEVVVVVQGFWRDHEKRSPRARAFVCESGGGMSVSLTAGGKIAGYWLADGTPGEISSNFISPLESETLAVQIDAERNRIAQWNTAACGFGA